jgi:hypothetical protein
MLEKHSIGEYWWSYNDTEFIEGPYLTFEECCEAVKGEYYDNLTYYNQSPIIYIGRTCRVFDQQEFGEFLTSCIQSYANSLVSNNLVSFDWDFEKELVDLVDKKCNLTYDCAVVSVGTFIEGIFYMDEDNYQRKRDTGTSR